MDYLDDVFARFASDDPALARAIAAGDEWTLAQVRRILRHTPLGTLARSRGPLVRALVAVPEMHDALRSTWARQDPRLTALIFAWVAQAVNRRTSRAELVRELAGVTTARTDDLRRRDRPATAAAR